MTRYYRFHSETFELDGYLDTEKRYPTNHSSLTAVEPPEAQEGYARVFDRETQKWSQVEDHRGKTVYSTETGLEAEAKLGALSTQKLTITKRPDETYKWAKTGWTQDATLKAAADKAKAEEEAREAARLRIAAADKVDPNDIAIALGLRGEAQEHLPIPAGH